MTLCQVLSNRRQRQINPINKYTLKNYLNKKVNFILKQRYENFRDVFQKAQVQNEEQTALFTIWVWVIVSISSDDNYYVTHLHCFAFVAAWADNICVCAYRDTWSRD